MDSTNQEKALALAVQAQKSTDSTPTILDRAGKFLDFLEDKDEDDSPTVTERDGVLSLKDRGDAWLAMRTRSNAWLNLIGHPVFERAHEDAANNNKTTLQAALDRLAELESCELMIDDREDLRKVINRRVAELEEAKGKIRTLERQKSDLGTEHMESLKENENLRQELYRANSKFQEKRKAIQTQSRSIADMLNKIQDLEGVIREKDVALTDQIKHIEKLESRNLGHDKRVTYLESSIGQQAATILAKDRRISDLRSQINVKNSTLIGKNELLATLEKEIKDQSERINELENANVDDASKEDWLAASKDKIKSELVDIMYENTDGGPRQTNIEKSAEQIFGFLSEVSKK